MGVLIRLLTTIFIFICIFDPADRLLGLKMPLFILMFLFFGFLKASRRVISLKLLYGVFVILLIPLISIFIFYCRNSLVMSFEGWSLYKSFLLSSLVLLLAGMRYSMLSLLSTILTLLSVTIICFYVFVFFFPEYYFPIFYFGEETGIFLIGDRVYDSDNVIFSFYFVTSPMIVVALAYYSMLLIQHGFSLSSATALFINIAGMFLAGTRSNMFVSILFPILILSFSKHYRLIAISLFVSILVLVFYFFGDLLVAMFESSEVSNQFKIDLIKDYKIIFSDLTTLLFGQGLGAYYNWSGRGLAFVSELTYLEIFRYFGIFFGSAIIFWMLLPLFYFRSPYLRFHFPLFLGYVLFLVMTALNPMFFSSMGVLIHSVLISHLYIKRLHSRSML